MVSLILRECIIKNYLLIDFILKKIEEEKMNKEITVTEKQRFPWDAFVLFLVVALLTGIHSSWMILDEVSILSFSLADYLTTGVLTVIGLVIALGFQYVLISISTQWIAKQKNVYKVEIISSLFYSSSIMLVIGILLLQFNLADNPIASVAQAVLGAVLFLMLYISGDEKEPEVKWAIKRVVVVVQVILFIIGQLLFLLTDSLLVPFL